MARSRWSLDFVKNFTIFEVGGRESSAGHGGYTDGLIILQGYVPHRDTQSTELKINYCSNLRLWVAELRIGPQAASQFAAVGRRLPADAILSLSFSVSPVS